MRSRVILYFVFTSFVAVSALAESAGSSFKAGEHAEKKNDYDTAYQAYKRAHDSSPNDPKFMAAFLRMRFYASSQHVHAGQQLRDEGKAEEALAEFRLAQQIDPSNIEASGMVHRLSDDLQRQQREKVVSRTRTESTALEQEARQAAGPINLEIKSDIPVSIQMTATTDVIYKTIGKLGGFNILMDPDYKPQKLTFELKDVTVREALNMLAVQSKTFWRPLSTNTIMVAPDNSGKRKELEPNVMKTFYLRNASTPADLQQAAGTLKGILDLNHIQVTPELRSLTVRGTPDQMLLAQRLLMDLDKPKAEVVIEVAVLEVSRSTLRTLGANLPTTVSASIAPGGTSTTSGSGSTGSSLNLNSFSSLGASDIAVSLGGASFTALATDSNTKVIQRPEIRVMDSEKASLKIGDRIPIATGSFQSGLTQGVNTQFQYIDVGVNVDITPYVHANNEVTLKMSLEVSSVTGEQTIDGVTEPTIGQRRIEHEARLADGEVNLIGGILTDSDTRSLSGYPIINKIPILKYLFGQENKQRAQNEIVFAIIPHVVRTPGITDENQQIVDLGSANTVTFRKLAAKTDPAPAVPAQGPAQVPAQVPAQPADRPVLTPRPQSNR